jgi:hypothetical protein
VSILTRWLNRDTLAICLLTTGIATILGIGAFRSKGLTADGAHAILTGLQAFLALMSVIGNPPTSGIIAVFFCVDAGIEKLMTAATENLPNLPSVMLIWLLFPIPLFQGTLVLTFPLIVPNHIHPSFFVD